ncbi:MAG: HemK family protein methyltransferase, partial [Candidatus Omnitrophota bacterium]
MVDYDSNIPVQYQEGKVRFLDMEISVDPRVLIPRPETEVLVEAAADMCRGRSWNNPLILDMCTGSGVVAMGIAKLIDKCCVIGADISTDALAVARGNIRRAGFENRVALIASDMFSAFKGGNEGMFDCIVSN